MSSINRLTRCFIALFFAIQILRTAECAPFTAKARNTEIAVNNKNDVKEVENFRQAVSNDHSDEDSDEDSGEGDADQAHRNLIEQQNHHESQENSEEDGDNDDDDYDYESNIRRRRDVQETTEQPAIVSEVEKYKETATAEVTLATGTTPAANSPVVTVETNSSPAFNRTSVLILIRDALKKVTTVLPTESVATNALQYFQLFEHFIQQTIEQVIEDYDEEEEETSTVAISVVDKPANSESLLTDSEKPNVDQSEYNKGEELLPVLNSVVEPVKEMVVEPVKEMVVEPVKEMVVEPVKETSVEPAKEMVVETVKKTSVKPAKEMLPVEVTN